MNFETDQVAIGTAFLIIELLQKELIHSFHFTTEFRPSVGI